MDLELGAVALVSGRVRRLVLGVEVAGDAAALLGGDPEVGAARIEDNLECLGRGTDGDLGEVCSKSVLGVTRGGGGRLTLGVHEVGDGDGVDAIGLGNFGLEHVVGGSVGASGAHVLLTEVLDMLRDGVGGLSLSSALCKVVPGSGRHRPVHLRASSYQLLRERNLLELHLVDASLGGAKQRSCGEKSALHDDDDGSGRRINQSITRDAAIRPAHFNTMGCDATRRECAIRGMSKGRLMEMIRWGGWRREVERPGWGGNDGAGRELLRVFRAPPSIGDGAGT